MYTYFFPTRFIGNIFRSGKCLVWYMEVTVGMQAEMPVVVVLSKI
jgi:hypothetical protein